MPNDVSQIFLNPPHRLFSNVFRQASDRPRIGTLWVQYMHRYQIQLAVQKFVAQATSVLASLHLLSK